MGNLFQFILDSELQLLDLGLVIWVIDLLGHFRCFCVQCSLEEGLCMIQLIRVYLRIEFRQLIVHICRLSVILDVIVAISEQGKCRSTPWCKLELVVKNRNDFLVFLVPNQRVDGLRELAVWHRSKWLHFKFKIDY